MTVYGKVWCDDGVETYAPKQEEVETPAFIEAFEVADEHDRSRAGVTTRAGMIMFPGNLRPDELEEQTGLVIPEDGPYETVGGFIMNELGRIPKVDDEIVDHQGTYRVVHMDGRRVDRIRFTPAEPEGGESNG